MASPLHTSFCCSNQLPWQALPSPELRKEEKTQKREETTDRFAAMGSIYTSQLQHSVDSVLKPDHIIGWIDCIRSVSEELRSDENAVQSVGKIDSRKLSDDWTNLRPLRITSIGIALNSEGLDKTHWHNLSNRRAPRIKGCFRRLAID